VKRRRPSLRSLAPTVLAVSIAAGTSGCADRQTAPDLSPPAYALAARCGTCHPQQLADWESSMHAYAAADPVMLRMREMVQQEGVQGIGAECFNCHRPGVVRAETVGEDPEPFADDGLTCDVCHSIDGNPPEASIAFLLELDPNGAKVADLPDPLPTEAHPSSVRAFFSSSSFCAPCHQVNLSDGMGLENTFREWQQTILSGMGVECQRCHMPAFQGMAATQSVVAKTLHSHRMVGVDYAYDSFRGIDLQQQKDDIRALLQGAVTVETDVPPASVPAGGTLPLVIRIVNDRTGHSIPSGVSFAREMWMEIVVRDTGAPGDPIYHSGRLAANGDLVEDADLTFFGAKLYDAANQPTLFSWRAASIDESLLLPYARTRTAGYDVPVGTEAVGPLAVEATLHFRPIAPPLIRALGLPELLPIEVFDMWSASWTVAVTP